MSTSEEEIKKLVLERHGPYASLVYLLMLKYIDLATRPLSANPFIDYVSWCDNILRLIEALDNILTPEDRKEIHRKVYQETGLEKPPKIERIDELVRGVPFAREKLEKIKKYCGAYISAVMEKFLPLWSKQPKYVGKVE